MEVNPNTVQRAYDLLQQQNIITNKRGIGYFTGDDAMERIMSFRREQFIENELPALLRNMFLLKIDFREIKTLYDQFVAKNFKKKV
jgi:GntR family transcriptional regulator